MYTRSSFTAATDNQTSQESVTLSNRRDFLKLMTGVGTGLTIAVNIPPVLAQGSDSGRNRLENTGKDGSFAPNAFIRISSDDKVILVMKHLEMGQGTFTGLSTLIAEELDADWNQIQPEGAPADTARYKNLHWGAQGTGGSSAIANSFEQMRIAGATAKTMLVAAAAIKWQVPAAEISVKKGVVSHDQKGYSARFGELAELAAQQPIPETDSIQLKDPKDFVLIGRSLPRKDRGKTNGSAIYTQDVKMEGLLTTLVAHPPRFGGRLRSFDDSKARTVKGVVNVVKIPSGVAVLAKDFWSAKQGRDLLVLDWDESQAIKQDSKALMDQFKRLAEEPGISARSDGDINASLANAATLIEASYEFPYLAHSAMEPMNCVARVNEQGCEIWNGEQVQSMDQGAVANALGIAPEQVKINMLYAGGSFGRRANPQSDYVLEAAYIAKAVTGTPIKLVWTREDDTRGGYYRPMNFHKIRAGLDDSGNLIAWDQRIVGQSIAKGTAFEAFMVKDGVDATSVEGAYNLPYQIPNFHVDLHTVDLQVPIQWWRSVGHSHTAFSTEVFIDRLARASAQDPVDFRLKLLKQHPRHRGVLELVAKKANWGTPLPKGWGRGVAVHKSFNTYVAQVAEVSLQADGNFKVERVVCAVDCGIAINPDIIRAQMEGGIGFGLSPALMSEITLDESGQVKQSNFHDYQVLRITQMPEIEVHIVASAEPPTGVGEPGTPPIAPAVANALTDLTGQHFNKLPLKLS
ncbi:twin-arginine translocation pathway signal protein [Motiliproteus sp. MSK22-1]|nr:twin-arginine translocation pathway signal protein [Motiliproteus sp. MSK22-1]